ncbi:MAG: Ribosomal RNA large subunit methyltransferase K/L [Chlamydiae bacterium]|nr:Ribosomal RNA large subunit methyltransferase K/L [Chlamydiota bacterium]
MKEYQLLDSGYGEKIEWFGDVLLIRPCPQAIWSPSCEEEVWAKVDGRFSREEGNRWERFTSFPKEWEITLAGMRMLIKPTDFGHLGVFPEHAAFWPWIGEMLGSSSRLLNLFAYSGGASLAAAKSGCSVTHVDSSKGMTSWASENARMNDLEKAPIRWIVEDALKYVARAKRRAESYEGIILDPPTFGRGKNKEVFKIEEGLYPLLLDCADLLSEEARFLLVSCHTPGITPLVLQQLVEEVVGKRGGRVESGEMELSGPKRVPSGTYARWIR